MIRPFLTLAFFVCSTLAFRRGATRASRRARDEEEIFALDLDTLDERTLDLAILLTERIKEKGYKCFDRDETFFRYVITTSLNRKPRATVNIDLLCEN